MTRCNRIEVYVAVDISGGYRGWVSQPATVGDNPVEGKLHKCPGVHPTESEAFDEASVLAARLRA